MLTRAEDYAFQQPSLTRKKLRRLELQAGAPRWQGGRTVWSLNQAMRQAERELARQAELAYQRTVADWKRTQAHRDAAKRKANKEGAGATPGRASQGRQSGKQRGRASVPDPAL